MTIPCFGYRIETRKRTVDRDSAPEVLTVAVQQKITDAIRNDNDVTITKHVVVCSSCGKETPAYPEFLIHDSWGFNSKSQAEIEEWTTRQLSLFGEPPKIMSFNFPVKKLERFICPRCNAVLSPSINELHVMIRAEKNKIKIMRALDFEDFFSIKWIDQPEISEFDLYETITFNLRNGHTYVSLENETGRKYAVRDISNTNITNMSQDPIFELIQIYKPVYRVLKRFFRKFWNDTPPFSPLELDLEKYILLTKFIGFNRDFYNALPFSNTGICIGRSFAVIAKQLHNANNVPILFETSHLPNLKTVRKIVFSNPALLFYQKEMEILWQILNNPNFFRTFLESKNIYRELSFLHRYPSMEVFYKELAAAVGQRAFCNYLSKGNRFFHSYALKYLLLNDYEKNFERKKWTSSFFSKADYRDARRIGESFSVPILSQNNDTATLECRIDGYSFIRLCNSKEYSTAGKELRNCLGDWEMFEGSVYGISKGGKYVAAVEIKDGVILQAHTYRNGEMNANQALFSAFSIWKERSGVKEYDDNDAENEE